MTMTNHPVPLDPVVANAVALLDANQREAFEERAAIMEVEAGVPRIEAERLALADIHRRFCLRLR